MLETGTIRKIDRRYPFNDACQWFIDHADLIILVYDYAKLDIGPETEALLDQLKGRESQVRIVLNKADEITAEELLKIQGNLVWNVSPLMASVEPPTLYAGSFWSRPYKVIRNHGLCTCTLLTSLFSGWSSKETSQVSGNGSAQGYQGCN